MTKVVEKHYFILDTLEVVKEFFDGLSHVKGIVSFDVESQNASNGDVVDVFRDTILGIGISWKEGYSAYLPLRYRPPLTYDIEDFWEEKQAEVIDLLRVFLENPSIKKGGQNKKYDREILCCDLGIVVKGVVFDTLYASHNLDENQTNHKLETQVTLFIKGESKWKEVADHSNMASMTLQDIAKYCNTDTDMERRLCIVHQNRLDKYPEINNLYHNYTMHLDRVTEGMEMFGAAVDAENIPKLRQELTAENNRLLGEMRRNFGKTVKVGTTNEVLEALERTGTDLDILMERDDNGKPIYKNGKISYKTDRTHLEIVALDSPLAQLILDTRAVDKLLSTYVNPIEQKMIGGRIHGNFLVHGTVSGRLASRAPNLQNIPRGGEDLLNARHVWGKRVKGLYIARKHWKLICADFSQMEVRCLAYYANDDEMARACDSMDVHLATAAQIFQLDFDDAYRRYKAGDKEIKELRQAAKSVTFLVAYGGSAQAAAKMYHLKLEIVEDFIKRYFEKYSSADAWIKSIWEEIDKYKYVVSKLGRHRRIPYAGEKGLTSRAHRQAVNSLIQGTAADICGMALIRLWDRLVAGGFQGRPELTVHDSIIVECPDEEVNDIVHLMQAEMTKKPIDDFEVPLHVDLGVGERWSELSSVKVAA